MQVCGNVPVGKPVFRHTDGKQDEQAFVASVLAGVVPKIAQFFYGERGAAATCAISISARCRQNWRAVYRTYFDKNPASAQFLSDIETNVRSRPAP